MRLALVAAVVVLFGCSADGDGSSGPGGGAHQDGGGTGGAAGGTAGEGGTAGLTSSGGSAGSTSSGGSSGHDAGTAGEGGSGGRVPVDAGADVELDAGHDGALDAPTDAPPNACGDGWDYHYVPVGQCIRFANVEAVADDPPGACTCCGADPGCCGINQWGCATATTTSVDLAYYVRGGYAVIMDLEPNGSCPYQCPQP